MSEWRKRLAKQRKDFWEDDQQDEMVLQVLIEGLGEQNEEVERYGGGGSRPGKRPNIDRSHVEGHERMMKDYFADEPVYGPGIFRRRYRMQRGLFLRIMNDVCDFDPYFVQRRNCAGVMGLSSHQKCTAALRILAYGVCGDSVDEYYRLSESTAMEAMKRYAAAVRVVFGSQYLRQPTREDILRHMRINEERGFPGMFGSIDCMHWAWKNCPVAWAGQFQDKDKQRSIILEVIATQDLWIWHAFFGMPGSNNDVNVLDRSPFVNDLLQGASEGIEFEVNGKKYPRYYLLADGIYPPWSCFVQTIHSPQDEKRSHYAKVQEATRKDVERCFGVLQARFAIIANPCRQWDTNTMQDIMQACIILHNMIVENESVEEGLEALFQNQEQIQVRRGLSFQSLVVGTQELENHNEHFSLKGDLIEHLWKLKGDNIN